MLILTRRAGEALMIGENVSIKVLGVKGNQVRIGIDAPKDVAVHREEIFDKIWGNNVVVGGRTIDVHVRKLREKLGRNYIETVKGVGYKFKLNE